MFQERISADLEGNCPIQQLHGSLPRTSQKHQLINSLHQRAPNTNPVAFPPFLVFVRQKASGTLKTNTAYSSIITFHETQFRWADAKCSSAGQTLLYWRGWKGLSSCS